MLREVELAEPSGSGRAAAAAGAANADDDDDDDARLLPAELEPEAGGAGQGTMGSARFWRPLRNLREALHAEPLLLQTLAGVAVGLAVGAIARLFDPSPRAVELLGFPGELFMRLLRALVLPLVSVSMVCGVLALFERTSGPGAKRAAARLVGAYAVTTCVACAIGLVVVSVVRPGAGVSVDGAKCGSAAGATERDDDDDAAPDDTTDALDSTLATARAAVPANVFRAAAEGNVLGVIAASLFFGTALAVNLNREVRTNELRVVADAFLGVNAIVETAVGWAVASRT